MNVKDQNGVVKNKIIEFIKKQGQASPAQISFELQISQSMTQRHLLKLLKERKIIKKGMAPKVFYSDLMDEKNQIILNPKLDLYSIIKNVESTMEKYNVKKAELFGSVSRGDFTTKSDVDILVDFNQVPGGWTLMSMIYELESKLGKKVDLVTTGGLSPNFAPYIKNDLKTIYTDKVHI